MKITLLGETPSKKNSRINTKSGRSFPNQRYVKWHDAVVSQLHFLLLKKQLTVVPEGVPVKLSATFYHSDMKRRDSDNQLSSVLDTLTDVGIICDDNWKVIPEKHIYDFYDKKNARCEIVIEELKDFSIK